MTEENVREAISTIKLKNSDGCDRIPQRMVIEGADALIKPFTQLYDAIYKTGEIPEQWLMAKVTPIHKKGDSKNIENYRPVAARHLKF